MSRIETKHVETCLRHVCCGVFQRVAVCCSVVQCQHLPEACHTYVGSMSYMENGELCHTYAFVMSHVCMRDVTRCNDTLLLSRRESTRTTCCSVLQCVAACYSVLQCVAGCVNTGFGHCRFSIAVCCSVLQCAAVCHNVLQWVAVCCSVLHCGTVCNVALRSDAGLTCNSRPVGTFA